MYSLRIVTVDYYMTTPTPELDALYSDFQCSEVQQVPVLRIFGPSLEGIKTCLHVHGVFPYIYIPYGESTENVNSFMYQIAHALDKAINISLGEANSRVQHVYKVILVSGIPFYGYHPRKHKFLKILFYNPYILRKACNLLQNGGIMGKVYQPHEAHINFTLQFMIDYNLHGMNFINLSQITHRFSPNYPTPPELTMPPNVRRISTSASEIDAMAQDIVRETFISGTISNPGIAALWEDEKQRLRNANKTSQITPQISQSRENVPPTKSHVGYLHLLKDRLQIMNETLASSTKSSDFDNSVYAAESPEDEEQRENPLNASQITFTEVSRPETDEATPRASELDDHSKKFLQVLRDLAEIPNVQEDDSILSQTVIQVEEDVVPEDQEDEEDGGNLNLTLADLGVDGDFWNESFEVPQADGPTDLAPPPYERFRSRFKPRLTRNSNKPVPKTLKKGLDMPRLDPFNTVPNPYVNLSKNNVCAVPKSPAVKKVDEWQLVPLVVPCDSRNSLRIKLERVMKEVKPPAAKPVKPLQKMLRDLRRTYNETQRRMFTKATEGPPNSFRLIRPKFRLFSAASPYSSERKLLDERSMRFYLVRDWRRRAFVPPKRPKARRPKVVIKKCITLTRNDRIDVDALRNMEPLKTVGGELVRVSPTNALQICKAEEVPALNIEIVDDQHMKLFQELSELYDSFENMTVSEPIRNDDLNRSLDNLCMDVCSRYENDTIPFESKIVEEKVDERKPVPNAWTPTEEDLEEFDRLFGNKTQEEIVQTLKNRERRCWKKISDIIDPYFQYGCSNSNLIIREMKQSTARTRSRKRKGILKKRKRAFQYKHVSFDERPIKVHVFDKDSWKSWRGDDHSNLDGANDFAWSEDSEDGCKEDDSETVGDLMRRIEALNEERKTDGFFGPLTNVTKRNRQQFRCDYRNERTTNRVVPQRRGPAPVLNSLKYDEYYGQLVISTSSKTNPAKGIQKIPEKKRLQRAHDKKPKKVCSVKPRVYSAISYDGCNDEESESSSDEEILLKKKRLKNLKGRKKELIQTKEWVSCRYVKKRRVEERIMEHVPKLTAAEEYDLKNKSVPIAAASTADLSQDLLSSNLNGVFMPKFNPPTRADILSTLKDYDLPEVRFQEPFYSSLQHVTGKQDVGHRTIKISSETSADCSEFLSSLDDVQSINAWRSFNCEAMNPEADMGSVKASVLCKGGDVVMEPNKRPPSVRDVRTWLRQRKIHEEESKETESNNQEEHGQMMFIPSSPGENKNDSDREDLTLTPVAPSPELQALKLNDSEQITGATLDDTYGFKPSLENLGNARSVTEYQRVTLLFVEIHVQTRAEFLPDPELDPIRAIFYTIFNDVPESLQRETTGAFIVKTLHGLEKDVLQGTGSDLDYRCCESELRMLEEFSEFVVKTVDPDMIAGYEIEMASWGYLIERGSVLGADLTTGLSRIPTARKRFVSDADDNSLKVEGRIVLDVWRLMRHEVALTSYTFENVVYHIMHLRVPKYSYKELNYFWEHSSSVYRRFTIDYYKLRVELTLKLFHKLDLIGRTSELARLFGIQFYEVLSRGSQFRVESMMLRLAKPMNYVAVSPSVQQRAKMRAPEYLPLILEPESKMYVDPVIVLDFQSLYPSMIIAYNYCFSTCLGRLEHFGSDGPFEFGATMLKTTKRTLEAVDEDVNFSPVGVGFVKSSIRQGILPTMLREILETRLMVKKSMKENRDDKVLQKVLHSRQLGLKLIANVTYGYTAANFSGRMPCVEIADSVVSKGRETLERAIKLVEDNEKWNAKVVYGDTDSLFVLVKGRTKEAAFKIGDEICQAVNAENPQPVKLKLEKVYQPCILQTKKRYVGYMYETPAQREPTFEAKGIETVRRDGCPAVSKMLEKSLKLLFDTKDVSLVRNYVCRQFGKLLAGRVNLQDLTFAKEYRGAKGYRPGACVPALELSRKWVQVDKRREPRRSERVPYVIVNGPPGVPLIRLVRSPMEVVLDPGLSCNVIYYITKVIIPPLNRCFSLIGADLNVWFNEMSRKAKKHRFAIAPTSAGVKKSTIAQYFATTYCLLCNRQTKEGLCSVCAGKPQASYVLLQDKINGLERNAIETDKICKSCCGQYENLSCVSLDCPVFYKRKENARNTVEVEHLRSIVNSLN